MEVGGMLPSHSQEEISPIKEGDYVGEDGFINYFPASAPVRM